MRRTDARSTLAWLRICRSSAVFYSQSLGGCARRLRAIRSLHADQIQRALRSRVGHEPLPHAARPQVFRTEQRDSSIDSDHVRANPPAPGIECVGKSVAPVDALPILQQHRSHGWNANVRSKHERTRGGAGNDGPVDAWMLRRASPVGISLGAVRSGDAPHISGIPFVLRRKIDEVCPLRASGGNRIRVIIDAVTRSVSRWRAAHAVAKIQPGL